MNQDTTNSASTVEAEDFNLYLRCNGCVRNNPPEWDDDVLCPSCKRFWDYPVDCIDRYESIDIY